MPMLQRRARNPKVLPGKAEYFEATDHVQLLETPRKLDRAEGDIHGDGNPHIQLDPRRLLEVAEALSARLQMLDVENKGLYQRLLLDFSSRWESSIQRWQSSAAALQGKRVIVHHRGWIYLLDWLGMQRAGSLEPKPGIPPNMAHIAALKKQHADLIIVSPLNDPKPSNWLRKQTGTPVTCSDLQLRYGRTCLPGRAWFGPWRLSGCCMPFFSEPHGPVQATRDRV